MYARLASVIAAAILAASSAIAQTPPTVHLVWLITQRAFPADPNGDNTGEAWNAKAARPAGYPLGVFVWPAEMPLVSCVALARINQAQILTAAQVPIGNFLGHMLGVPLETGTPLCLTTAEAAKLVEAVKNQHDQPPGRDS